LIHFSGHGTHGKGLNFADSLGNTHRVTGQSLARLFRLSDVLECVVLNACHSVDQAEAISRHIHCVIGMEGEIGDEAAIAFSTGLYDSLTAGETYGTSFEMGVNAIDLANLTDSDRPVLYVDGVRQ
jgi:hypothetical protein